MGKERKILLFAASVTPANRLCYDGVFRYARAARWNVHIIEYGLAAKKRQHLAADTVPDVKELLKMWQPDGVIVECGGCPPVLPLSDFGNLPLVLLSCHPQQAGKACPCVYSDDLTIARIAARELLSLGFLDYAFVAYPKDVIWSHEREAAFLRLVKADGKRTHKLHVGSAIGGKDVVEELVNGLVRLPKPCGVFAANDVMGREVVSACELAGLAIPKDVAVVGVDNDEALCEQSQVSLSSIRIDYETSGFSAAELLDHRMKIRSGGRQRTKIVNLPMAVSGLVRRASSRRCIDARVAKALEHIRIHALERVTPSHIATLMGVSRQFADMMFLSIVGQTIFGVVREARIERVKDMLAVNGRSIESIASMCGYRSLSTLCREFKHVTGFSMRDWRKNWLMAHNRPLS